MKRIPIAALLVFFTLQSYGIDYGLDTKGHTSVTAYADSDESPEPESTVSMLGWIRSPAGRGSVTFRGGAVYNSLDEETLPSLTALNWKGYIDPAQRIHLSIGRIGSSDPSGLIGRSSIDGAAFKLRTGGIDFLVNLGYAGLLFKEDTNITVTPNDLYQVSDEDKVFGVPRILGTAVLGFPAIMGRHDLDIQLTGQFDLWDSSDGGFEPLHTQYTGIRLEGPLSAGFFYRLSGVLGTADLGGGSPGVSGAGSASVDWLNTALLSLRISAGVSAATGDPDRDAFISDDGSGTQFIPIVPQAIGHAAEVSLPNNAIGHLKVSVKPLRTLLAELALMPVYRLTDGPVNYQGSTGAGMAGVETDLTAAYAPSSDIRIDAAAGLFLPAADNTADEYDSIKWSIKGALTIKM